MRCSPQQAGDLAQDPNTLGLQPVAAPYNSSTLLCTSFLPCNRVCLLCILMSAAEWERALKTPGGIKQLPTSNQAVRKKRVESYAAKAITDDHMADL